MRTNTPVPAASASSSTRTSSPCWSLNPSIVLGALPSIGSTSATSCAGVMVGSMTMPVPSPLGETYTAAPASREDSTRSGGTVAPTSVTGSGSGAGSGVGSAARAGAAAAAVGASGAGSGVLLVQPAGMRVAATVAARAVRAVIGSPWLGPRLLSGSGRSRRRGSRGGCRRPREGTTGPRGRPSSGFPQAQPRASRCCPPTPHRPGPTVTPAP